MRVSEGGRAGAVPAVGGGALRQRSQPARAVCTLGFQCRPEPGDWAGWLLAGDFAVKSFFSPAQAARGPSCRGGETPGRPDGRTALFRRAAPAGRQCRLPMLPPQGSGLLRTLSASLIFLIRNQETGSDSTQNIASIMIRLGEILCEAHAPPACAPGLMAVAAEGTVFLSGLHRRLAPGHLPAGSLGPICFGGSHASPLEPQPLAAPHGQTAWPCPGRSRAPLPLFPAAEHIPDGGLALPSSWGPFGAGTLQREPALFLRFRVVGEDPRGSGVCCHRCCGLLK